jgi:hypothetical protein
MIPETIFAAKGDLLGASANDTPAIISVGANGETLVADSSTSTGLRYQANFAAGKNKIINGDFNIWQRGTSFTSNGVYTTDRFVMNFGGSGTAQTVSQQTFTPGTAPVAGYEGTFFARNEVTGGSGTDSLVVLTQKVENVRTFAGQTVTFSFWAKADTGTPSIGLDLYQEFGSGGSSTVSNGGTKVAITTSWARYSATISLASVSGKTIGAGSLVGVRFWFSSGSDYNSLNGTLGIQSNTFDIWGVQVEAGSVATAFQTATGTIQGELAACQRYFQRLVNGSETTNEAITLAQAYGTVGAIATLQWIVPMRTTPTMTISSASHFAIFNASASDLTATAFALTSSGTTSRHGRLDVTVATGLVGGNAGYVRSISASSTLDVSAEL